MNRKIQYITAALLLIGGAAQAATKTVSYLENVAITSNEVSLSNRMLTLDMTLDLSAVKVKTQHSIELVPVIISQDGSRMAEFPAIYIDGCMRHAAINREQAMEHVMLRDTAATILKNKDCKNGDFTYSESIRYESWMLEGKMELRETTTGCLKCGLAKAGTLLQQTAVERYIPAYSTDMMELPVENKLRSEIYVYDFHFRQNSSKVDNKFMDNDKALENIRESINAVLQNKDHELIAVNVNGYASPEGSQAYNQRLSERRANNFAKELKKGNEHIADSLWVVKGMGEDWNFVTAKVKEDKGLNSNAKIMEILAAAGPDNYDKSDRMLAVMSQYKYMYNNIYPAARRIECRIDYAVRKYSAEEAAEIISVNPAKLNAREMYSVAGKYEKNSSEYRAIIKKTAEVNADNVAALNNAAIAYIAEKDFAGAVAVLAGKAGNDATALNTLGVAYAQNGDYVNALECFEKAGQAGNKAAEANLAELNKVLEQL